MNGGREFRPRVPKVSSLDNETGNDEVKPALRAGARLFDSVALGSESALANDIVIRSFLPPVAQQTRVQQTLRAALEHVHMFGVCEFAENDQPKGVYYVSVCGLPVQQYPPSQEADAAARLILDELSRGSGGEEDCVGVDYEETLEIIMIYFDACGWGDAEACASIEKAHASAGRRAVSVQCAPPFSSLRLH